MKTEDVVKKLRVVFNGCSAILFIAIFVFAYVSNQSSNSEYWIHPLIDGHSVTLSDPKLEQSWVKDSIFLQGGNKPIFSASQGVLLFVGFTSETKRSNPNPPVSTKQKPEYLFTALSARDGSVIWQKPGNGISPIRASSSTAYAGLSNTVLSYELLTGRTIWTRKIFSARNIVDIQVWDDRVTVNGVTDTMYLLSAQTGDILAKTTYDSPQNIYLVADGVAFSRRPSATYLQALHFDTGVTLWETYLNTYYQIAPEFTQDYIYVRTGDLSGEVIVLDRQIGKILWRSSPDVVSNVAAAGSKAYFLTEQGQLQCFDALTLEHKTLAAFEPSPFILISSESHQQDYYVAVVPELSMIFVYVGDSDQLFAFKFEPATP